MNKPTETSPFAALTSQEQKEKWICWQSQKMRQEEKMNLQETPDTQTDCKSGIGTLKPTHSREIPPIHHGQYDAVLKRMQLAGRKAGQYVECK